LNPDISELITKIKTAIISNLDSKRPNIQAIGYTEQDSLINANQLSAIVQDIINTENGTFISFTLKNTSDEIILLDYLGIGALAYLNSLTINGSAIEL